MAALQAKPKGTLDAVDAAIEAAQDTQSRPYLGMSQIGSPCERALWYGFHWVAKRVMPASSIKAIEDGFLGEDVMAKRLRMVPGITLHTEDPSTKRQFGLEALGGHFRGHLDGAILGLVEAPKTWHVWEHKQVNEDKFKKLEKAVASFGEKGALKEWDAVYHDQAQSYMGFTGMDRHYLTVATPGGRAYMSVRTEFDSDAFEALVARAQRVIEAKEPPQRLSEDPAFYLCKWCSYHPQCHGEALPDVNCRTCAHSTPRTDEDGGRWHCGLEDLMLDVHTQRDGCNGHRFIPVLLQRVAQQVDAVEEVGGNHAVVYQLPDGTKFANGYPPNYASREIKAAKDLHILDDEQVKQVKQTFRTAEVVA